MNNTEYNADMFRKTLGTLFVTISMGVPFFAMAGCSVSGGTVDTCSTISGTWTADPATAGVVTQAQGTAGVVTQAPSTNQGTSVKTQLQNPIKFDTFFDFVVAVLDAAVNILLPFVVLAFVYSGFLFVKAQGNETELENAKSAIKWSVVGTFILLGAKGFAQIIGTTISTITK